MSEPRTDLPRFPVKDPAWERLLQQAFVALQTLPASVKQRFIAMNEELAEYGTNEQIPPEQMLVACSVLMASFILNDGIENEAAINRSIEFAHATIRVVVAAARIEQGFVPPSKRPRH